MAIDFNKVPRAGRETYTFFAASMRYALSDVLKSQGVSGFEIVHASEAKERFGVAPDGPVRLTEGSPRAERNVTCLVSDFDPVEMGRAIRRFPDDDAYSAWADAQSEEGIAKMRSAGDWNPAWD